MNAAPNQPDPPQTAAPGQNDGPSPFDCTIERAGSGALKYDLREKLFGRADVEPLWVADMDFASPDCIVDALRQRLDHPVFGYGLRPSAMTDALVDWLERRQGWSVDPASILFSPGVVPSLALAVGAFSQPGDGVVVQPPVYPPFFSCVEGHGRRLLRNPLVLRDNRFYFDLEGLERLLGEESPALLLLCSPHNPGGRVWRRQELAELVGLCERHGCLVVSDEIHADLCHSDVTFTPAGLVSERVISLTSPGKSFNIAGITPSATLIGDPALRQRFQQALSVAHLTDARVLGDIAFTAAYQQGGAWLDKLLAYLGQNRAMALRHAALHWPGIQVMAPDAGFLLWLDCRGLALDDAALSKAFIDAGLGLSAGVLFGAEGSGFMRLNFALPRQRLAAALQRIDGLATANCAKK